jgi:hypothetical protein
MEPNRRVDSALNFFAGQCPHMSMTFDEIELAEKIMSSNSSGNNASMERGCVPHRGTSRSAWQLQGYWFRQGAAAGAAHAAALR